MGEPPPSSSAEVREEHEPKIAAVAVEEDGELAPVPLSPSKPDGGAPPTPEDLVARAIAPVKANYLRPPPARHCWGPGEKNQKNSVVSESKDEDQGAPSNAPVVAKGKKSRRQLKRERKQERKSARNICPVVAKTGDANACRFGGNCRFSHDLDGFLAQKTANLPGTCPFLGVEESCPYGAACMFSSTHKEVAPSGSSDDVSKKKCVEVNSLNKDLQKLLWKKKVKFPNSDAQLKLLGLLGKNKLMAKAETVLNGSDTHREDDGCETTCKSVDDVGGPICLEMDILDDASCIDDPRPPKKAKSPVDENLVSNEVNNGTCDQEGILEECHTRDECDDTPAHHYCGSKVELIPVLNARERKLIDFRGKLYLAPLTTVGNLPFRRVCKTLGADITCGEMAMCTNLLQGQASEWALLRRHSFEDVFGVQLCGAYPDTIAHTVELIDRECTVDFIDINMGCPIDIVVNKGAGSSLLTKPMRMKNIIQAACGTAKIPITVKARTAYFEGRNRIDSLVADISQWGASAITIHGRSRQQRYSKLADWDYIYQCARKSSDALQVLGNGDVFSYLDWNQHSTHCPQLSTCMVARGALIKPWILTEIKEQRHWDITSGERFGILKDFVHFGLEHWGSDNKGVETTRHFLLEWLSYTYRYVPVGLLDVVPQRLNWRPPSYFGRDDLETLMASDSAADWIRISEMLLGKVPEGFTFAPKHKSNAYDRADNG